MAPPEASLDTNLPSKNYWSWICPYALASGWKLFSTATSKLTPTAAISKVFSKDINGISVGCEFKVDINIKKANEVDASDNAKSQSAQKIELEERLSRIAVLEREIRDLKDYIHTRFL